MKRFEVLSQLLAALCAACWASHAQPSEAAADTVIKAARQIEAQLDARVGLAIIDTANGARWGYRANERFAMTSTFKVLACAALLSNLEDGKADPDHQVVIEQDDLVAFSPVTETWVDKSVTLEALCETTLRTSDNTAANKVMEALGGPKAVTAFVRSTGDQVTRLDRWETELNEAIPHDPRDTTTPAAMAASIEKLLLGDALQVPSQQKLTRWMVESTTGGPLLRASIPENWRIGDRTGAGGHGSRSVVAILWPPHRGPLIAAIYLTQTGASMEQRNGAIASIGNAIVEAVRTVP